MIRAFLNVIAVVIVAFFAFMFANALWLAGSVVLADLGESVRILTILLAFVGVLVWAVSRVFTIWDSWS